MDSYKLLLLLAVFGVSLAGRSRTARTPIKAGEAGVCPRKQHLLGGRSCKKACTKDANCRGKRKRCVCDDVCGLTCLNPRGRCPRQQVANGRVRIAGKNQLGAVAKYTCSRGYELQGVETRICNGDREWSGTAPRCVPIGPSNGRGLRGDPVSDLPQNIESSSTNQRLKLAERKLCPEPPSIAFADHDGRKQNFFSPNYQVTYKCRVGFASEGITMAKCLTNGTWAGPIMSCREAGCSDLGELANGVRYGRSLEVNAKVIYECKKGYRLLGSPTLICRKGGQWDKRKPVCLQTAITSCERPRAPRHGSKIGRSYAIGSVVTIVCDIGYKISGSSKRLCQKDGTWSSSPPECLPIDCGHPGPLWNGYIEGRRYTYGSIIKYRCLDGTTFAGKSVSATCLESSRWSFPVPQCMKNCPKPSVERAANLTIGSRPSPISVEHGEELRIKCERGFTPNDKRLPVCNNGTWSHLPNCVEADCNHRPKEIANGMALYRGTKHGNRVRYRCNAGHKLIGDRYLTCAGGRWNGTVPQCKSVYCPHPGELRHGKILLVGDIGKFEYRPYVRHAGQGEKIEYYCSTGYRLEGPSAATCIDGTWSPERRPKCIDNQHPMLPGTQELFTT